MRFYATPGRSDSRRNSDHLLHGLHQRPEITSTWWFQLQSREPVSGEPMQWPPGHVGLSPPLCRPVLRLKGTTRLCRRGAGWHSTNYLFHSVSCAPFSRDTASLPRTDASNVTNSISCCHLDFPTPRQSRLPVISASVLQWLWRSLTYWKRQPFRIIRTPGRRLPRLPVESLNDPRNARQIPPRSAGYRQAPLTCPLLAGRTFRILPCVSTDPFVIAAMPLSPLAGNQPPRTVSCDLARLGTGLPPNSARSTDPNQRVSFGTSGTPRYVSQRTFTEAPHPAITRPFGECTATAGATGPLYMGKGHPCCRLPRSGTALRSSLPTTSPP